MVNVSWHPSRARCAVSVGRRVFLVDGVTGATLSCVRLPLAHVALAHAPLALGAALVVLLRDGSVHAADLDASRPSLRRLHGPTVNVKKRGLAPRDRRGHLAFSGAPSHPWVVFALPGDATLRAASLRGPAAGLDALGGGGSSGDHASLTSGSAGSSFGDGPGAGTGARASSTTAASIARRVGLVGVRADAKILPCFASAANTKNPSRASPGTPPNPSSSPRTSTAGFEPTTSRRKPPSPRSIDPRAGGVEIRSTRGNADVRGGVGR